MFSYFLLLSPLLTAEYPRLVFSERDPLLAGNTLCDNVKQISGYFEISGDKSYFFWFFEARNKTADTSTFMWLTGGPGCSSQMALFSENGPCEVTGTGEADTDFARREWSWTNNANGFWVDQPPGTGFSKGSFDHDEDGVARDMLLFLQHFFTKFPQYNSRFFVIGESYAGHYVPAISSLIHKTNKEGNGIKIALEGIAIGNGLTDPKIQYPQYPEMAFKGLKDHPVISQDTYDEMKAAVPKCRSLIEKCDANVPLSCEFAFGYCNSQLMNPYQATGLNPYDMRIKCEKPPLCYDFEKITTFLNLPQVQEKLGVNMKWQECNFLINFGFHKDWMHKFDDLIPPMMHDGIRVLIYAGNVDYICNWMGNRAWVDQLDWDKKEEWSMAKDVPWLNFGELKKVGNLAFMKVFDAGHMVPMDQPEASTRMIEEFMSNRMPDTIELAGDAILEEM